MITPPRVSRRGFLRLSGSSAAAVVLSSTGVQNALAATLASGRTATVVGRVFAADGAKRRALAGVLVSDGLNIAVTDRQGNYTLTIDPSRRLTDSVFVTMPAGYEVPVDGARTPQFFVRIDDLISGETRRGDFALTRVKGAAKPYGEFVHLTDVHVEGFALEHERERFRAQVEQLNRLTNRPDFILLSGDLSDGGTDVEYQAYQDAAGDSIDTIWTSVGNHDIYRRGGNDDYAVEIEHFRTYQSPEWYSFDWRGHHVVVIDNYDGGDLNPDGQAESTRNEQQFKWLAADLQRVGRRTPLIVVAHVALNDPLTIRGTERYIELLRRYDVRLALSGHTHRNDVDPNVFPGGIAVVTEPGWSPQDGGPVGFRRIILQRDGTFSIPFKAFDLDRRLAITHPAPGAVLAAGRLPVQVNARDTATEVESIELRLDGGPWATLDRDGVWTWVGDKATRVRAGSHRLDVRVRDDSGRAWPATSTFTAIDDAAPAPVAGADWPSFHGGATHGGSSTDAVTPPLRLAWTYRSGGGAILNSSPVVVDGIAYIGLKDENGVEQNGVAAVTVASGRERWRVRTDAAVDGTPSVADGRVHFTSIRGTVHAVDARRGMLLWERRFGIGSDGVQRYWGYACPIVVGGVVYQNFGHQILALDAATGSQLWSFNGGGDNSYLGMPSASEDGKTIYFPSKGDALWGLDAATGRQLWRVNPVDGLYRSTVAVVDGIVYARCGDIVLAVDGRSGAEVRRYKGLGYTYNAESPAVAHGALFSPGNNGNVHAFDVASGARLWSYRTGDTVESSPAVSGAHVYVGSHDGFLYALDRVTGALSWRYEIGPWVKSAPAVSGNAVLVGAYDGNLYCFVQDAAQQG
jgi:outer membrane protein assembly factor BamB/predicted MPP superfamily phosphohydrolase